MRETRHPSTRTAVGMVMTAMLVSGASACAQDEPGLERLVRVVADGGDEDLPDAPDDQMPDTRFLEIAHDLRAAEQLWETYGSDAVPASEELPTADVSGIESPGLATGDPVAQVRSFARDSTG